MLLLLHVRLFQIPILTLNPDTDDEDFYILGPELPLMFTPSQIKATIRPDTFTAQDAGIKSDAELVQFWNRIEISKDFDTTLQLSGKAPSYSFIHLIHLTMIQILLTEIFIIHYVLDYMTNLII